ncbi:tetratricopeptide repeat protein [Streptomyces sp. NPDC018045]|uniref:tetratricopeptide repeat protein n=1 Tax=Streptomyces sp. NPDC018045 TaxID=3365037 RepID=UPI0037B863C5
MLARLLAEADWTYSQLAMAVNRAGTETGKPLRYTAVSVHQWLNGGKPRKNVQPLVREAFARRLMRPVTMTELGFEESPAPSRTMDTVEGLVDLGRRDMDPTRRGVLGASLFSVALTIPAWHDVVGRAEAVQSGRSSRIGWGEVDMVIAMTDKLSEVDDQFGGRHARPMAASFLVNTVSAYLQADAPQEVREGMLSAASDLCYLTGYMAVDEGYHGLAQQYYLKALELAGHANDHLTYCTTLRGMSLQAVDLGHGQRAVRLADAAAAASPHAGPRMRAFLAGQQAHCYAQIGEKHTAVRYMAEAEVAMEKAESKEKALGSYDPSSLYYHIAQVKFEMGDLAGSVEAMVESDRLCYQVYRRSRVKHRQMIAERKLSIGHLEEACAAWTLALDEYPMVQSGRCDARFREMAALLKPYSKHGAAKELLDRYKSLPEAVKV